jgi:hypothetical protein
MERESIDVGWFILRPFTPDDIGWVYEVSRSRVGTRRRTSRSNVSSPE